MLFDIRFFFETWGKDRVVRLVRGCRRYVWGGVGGSSLVGEKGLDFGYIWMVKFIVVVFFSGF